MNISPSEAEEALVAIQKIAQKTRHAIASSGTYVTMIVTGTVWGFRMGNRVRSPAMTATAKRVGLFWLFLILYCMATIAAAWPLDGKQITVLIVLFALIGHLSMGLLLSFAAVWWPLPISALALISYFLLPDLFYLWMGVLGGGGMIALGLYIRFRW